MTIRFAIVGVLLLLAGAIDIGGLGRYTAWLGTAALLAAGVTWLAGRSRGNRSARK